MKKQLLSISTPIGLILLLTAFFVSCSHPDGDIIQRTTVSGEIRNYPQETTTFTYEVYKLFKNRESKEIYINPDGSFKMVLKTDAPLKGFFSLGKEPVTQHYTITQVNGKDTTLSTGTFDFKMVYLYLEPGDSLIMNLDVENIDKTLVFAGKGANNNRFVNEEENRFNDYKHKYLKNYYNITYREANDYKATVDQMKEEQLNFLEQYSSQYPISDKLKKLYKNRYQYETVTQKINYPSSHSHFNDGNVSPLPSDYYDFLDQIEFPDEIGSRGIGYYYYLNSALHTLHEKQNPETDYYDFVNAKLEGKAYYEFLALSLNRDFKKQLYEQFDENCPYPDIARLVKERYKHMEGMLEGNPAPAFSLEDVNGKTVSLESLRGKYIYIDFWATWCGPCKEEIPSLKALQKQYGDGNIHFVSISFDSEEDYPTWEEYVKKNHLTGIQLYADRETHQMFSEAFNIQMIPRFVLIDPEGNIVDANAPRPSDPGLKALLEELKI